MQKKLWTEYLLITLGTVMVAAGIYFFKIPNGFVFGGVSGIGTLFGTAFPFLTAGQWILTINVVLLIAGFLVLGKENGLRTLYCSLLLSLLTRFFEIAVPLSGTLTNQPFLEFVYAMILSSLGSALVFHYRASTGGTDIIAMILKKYSRLDIGKALLATDFVVATSSFWVFGVQAGLYSLLGLFVHAFLIDSVIDSVTNCKYFVVITNQAKVIEEYIIHELHHGVTATQAVGSYTGEEKVMLHTVCKRREALRLRRTIRKIEPHAFVIITTTGEIFGRGFGNA